MYYELYIDVFFLVNFMMDFLLLLFVKKSLKCTATHGKLCIGAAVGAFLTCMIIILPISSNIIKFILFHVFVNTCMIRAGLKIKTKTDFARAHFLLYIGSFLLGGILQFLHNYIREGSLFFTIAVVGYCIASQIWDVAVELQKVTISRCQVELYLGNKMLTVVGLIDTGNSLCDPITREPVHILELEMAKTFFSEESMMKVRYVPYHTIGSKGKVLYAIHIDRMRIQGEKELWIESPLIGISEQTVSAKGEYKMILNPKAF